jgi:hypothetical protein
MITTNECTISHLQTNNTIENPTSAEHTDLKLELFEFLNRNPSGINNKIIRK